LHILARQEQLFSPMVYHAVTPVNFQLQYENENETRLHVATVIFNNYNARWHDEYTYLTGSDEVKEVETSPTLITLVQARYGYLKKIKKEEKMTWLLVGSPITRSMPWKTSMVVSARSDTWDSFQ
jgi:hypothetical protein